MAITSVCTSCGYKQPLEAGLQDARARQAMAACLKIAPGLAGRIIQYLELFSPGDRALRMDRLASLLEELANDISAAQISRDGRVWPAPLDTWKAAFDDITAKRGKLKLPLKTHGYLYEIIVTYAMRAQGAAERKTEEQKQYKQHRQSSGGAKSVGEVLTQSQQGNAQAFRDAARKTLKGDRDAD